MARDSLTALGLDPREVADPQALELPDELDADVVAPDPLVEAAVGAQAEDAALDQHAAGGLEAVEQDAGEEAGEPSPGGSPPPPPRSAPVARRSRGGWSGRSASGRRAPRPGSIKRDLEVVVLQRLDHGAGVEPEHPGEPALWTRHCCRAETDCCSRSASMFRARSTSYAGTRSCSGRRSGRPGRAPARRCRASRRTCPGTGGRVK